MCSMTPPRWSASTSKRAVYPPSDMTMSKTPGVVSRPSRGSRVVTCRVVRVRCRRAARLPDSTIRPSRMIDTVSQSASASARMWLDSRTVPPAGRLVEQVQLDVRGQAGDDRDLLPVPLGVGAAPLGGVQLEPVDQLVAAGVVHRPAEAPRRQRQEDDAQVVAELDGNGLVGRAK